MTDTFRALCAELMDEAIYLGSLPYEQDPDPDLIARARAALEAQPEPQGPPKNCWLDDEPDLCPSPCVFDDPSEVIDNCLFAQKVKCKTDCKYYRAALAQPAPQGPSDEEIRLFVEKTRTDWIKAVTQKGLDPDDFDVVLARAVLARYGRPAIGPVPELEGGNG
jgi:hypothetical protein